MLSRTWVAKLWRQDPSSGLESSLLDGSDTASPKKSQTITSLGTALAAFLLGITLAGLMMVWPSLVTFKPDGVARVGGSAKLVQTAQGTGDLMASKADIPFTFDFAFDGPVVDVDLAFRDQQIVGFGGAFTEASALVYKGLSRELQEQLLGMYFGPDGIGYSLGRVPINSCDFSPASYSFDDVEGDYDLKHFDDNVTHDTQAMIPFIKAAQHILSEQGKNLRLLAAPWSPPAWMKTNDQMIHSGTPGLREECRSSWAQYISKWISAYKAHGIPLWALTAQNEPEKSQLWESCKYSSHESAEFIGHFLGPTIRRDHPEVNILAFDHDKGNSYQWANTTFSHAVASNFVQGIAVHWYDGDNFEIVRQVHTDFPHAIILPSEATYERYRWAKGTNLTTGDWKFGEGYAHDIMGDLNAGASGWTDWNLILDERGGPNHVDNVCDSAMMAGNSGELYIHPQYYFIGHFSKFLHTGSVRVGSSVHGTSSYQGLKRPYGTCSGEDGLEATSFLRPDGRVATVVLNCGDTEIRFKLRDLQGGRAIAARIPAHAVQTYLFERSNS